MPEGALRNLHCRGAMGIGNWPHRRVTNRSVVQIPNRVLTKPVRVLHAQLHHEVMRVLAVYDGLAVGCFASLEQQWIELASNGRGFQAKHGAQHQVTTAKPVQRAEHAPIGGVKLVGAQRPGLLRVYQERLRHPHPTSSATAPRSSSPSAWATLRAQTRSPTIRASGSR